MAGVSLAEIGRESGVDAADMRRALDQLESAGVIERSVHTMDETVMAQNDEYDAVTGCNDWLPDDEFDRLYAVEQVYSTTDDGMTMTEIMNAFAE